MRTLRLSLAGTGILALFLGPSAATVAESAELIPSGAERIVHVASVPDTLVRDGRGDVWTLGDGLMRFHEEDGTYALVGDWSLVDDAAFATWTVAAARDGGVWLGGPTIRRFDGSRFTEVIEGPPGSVFGLLEAPDGSLWAMVDDGSQPYDAVWRWDGSSWTDMDAGHAIGSLATDDQGRVWVMTGTYPGPDLEGVEVFDGTSWQAYGAGDQRHLSDADFGSLQVAPGGEVYARMAETLLAFDGSTWTEVSDDAVSGDWQISIGPDGTLWLYTTEAVFRRSPGGSFEAFEGPAGGWTGIRAVVGLHDGALISSDDGIHQVRAGSATPVWSSPKAPTPDPAAYDGDVVATETDVWISDPQGVWRCPVPELAAGCRLLDRAPSGPREKTLFALERSPEGTLWSTGPRGTSRLDGESWTVIDDAPGQTLTVAPDGTVWVLGAGGAGLAGWRQERSTWVAERHPAPAPAAGAQLLGILPDGTIWAYEGGWVPVLARFDGTSWTEEPQGSVAGRPLASVEGADVDGDGHLWVLWAAPTQDENALPVRATARLDGDVWTVFEIPAAWPDGLAVGPDGSAWLGGDDGLYRFDGSAWTPAGFAGSYLVPVDVAADGAVWFRTSFGGLYRMPAP